MPLDNLRPFTGPLPSGQFYLDMTTPIRLVGIKHTDKKSMRVNSFQLIKFFAPGYPVAGTKSIGLPPSPAVAANKEGWHGLLAVFYSPTLTPLLRRGRLPAPN